ncbi:hypothetical protein BGW42_008440 [Actinomortierella wolfii]|nr:hypothetical protein BGW42_008440 [Actinomortierella wolfii]
MPVTLRTLLDFKARMSWSGSKVASFVFYQLYTIRQVAKSDIRCFLEDITAEKDPLRITGVLQKLMEDMQDDEKVPVSKKVNKHLTDLAAKLQGEISNLNKSVVAKKVEQRIEDMIVEIEKLSCKQLTAKKANKIPPQNG